MKHLTYLVSSKLFVFLLLFLTVSVQVTIGQEELDSTHLSISDSLAKLPFHILSYSTMNGEDSLEIHTMDSFIMSHQIASPFPTLNNYGSPTAQALYTFPKTIAYRKDNSAFSPYLQKMEDYTYFFTNKPYAEINVQQSAALGNSSSGLINNLKTGVLFSIPFQDQIYWNLRYNRINHIGNYSHQKNIINAFSSQFSVMQKKYQLHFTFMTNNYSTQYNNGIISDSFFNSSRYDVRESIPVHSGSAKALYRDYTYRAFLRRQGVSLINLKFSLDLNSIYHSNNRDFLDLSPESTSGIYQLFPLQDSFAHLTTKCSNWSNQLKINFELFRNFKLQAGINQIFQRFEIDTAKFQKSIIALSGKSEFEQGLFRFILSSYFQLNQTDFRLYQLKASSSFHIHKEHLIFVELSSTGYAPQIQQIVLSHNSNLIWNNNFKPIVRQKVEIGYNYKWIDNLTVGATRLQNEVIPDQSSRSIQADKPIYFLSCDGKIKFQFRRFGLINFIVWRQFSTTIQELSYRSTKHELYYKQNFFRNQSPIVLSLRADLRYDKQGIYFHPLTDQFFYRQNSTTNTNILENLIASARLYVAGFELEIRGSHLDALWVKQRPSYVSIYPIFDTSLELGIRWKFYN